jgi:hypothetical protein
VLQIARRIGTTEYDVMGISDRLVGQVRRVEAEGLGRHESQETDIARTDGDMAGEHTNADLQRLVSRERAGAGAGERGEYVVSGGSQSGHVVMIGPVLLPVNMLTKLSSPLSESDNVVKS